MMKLGRKSMVAGICGLVGIALVGADTILGGGNLLETVERRASAILSVFFPSQAENEGVTSDAEGKESRYPDVSFHIPGVQRPILKPAHVVHLPGETAVIAVSVGGECRAYLPKAMSLFTTHVINDVVGGRALTITYCNRNDCVRVLTKAGCSEPLDVCISGFQAGQLSLELDGQSFGQNAEGLPLEDVKYTRTTWREWRAEHRQGEVYVGNVAETGPSDSAD